MPITITIEAANADEARQLVQDLAGTIAGMRPADVPIDTKVTTITPPAAPTIPIGQMPNPYSTVTTAAYPPQAPVTPAQPPAPAPVVPTSAPSYSVEQLGTAAAGLMQAGKQQELIGLLQQFGVPSLVDLPPERYGDFATALRGLGAQI